MMVTSPRCPGCDQEPLITFGGTQAFCGNDDCRVVSWDRSDDPAQFKAKAQLIDLSPLDPKEGADG